LPLQIIISGDSAGGNAVVAIMSHILHPHPAIKPLSLSAPLGGCLLFSPWVNFETTSKSMSENSDKDILPAWTIEFAASTFVDKVDENEYTTALTADPSWWKGFPAKKILILGGMDEIFRDDIVEFGSKVQQYNEQARVRIFEHETHEGCITDTLLGLPEMDMAKATFSWLEEFK
jgi:acetyl esterase/lipase